MKTLSLPGTGRRTTQLGFGGSSLMGAATRRESLLLLEQAYDAGIRHFDVAPMYGYGAAEGCLGEFLARHPGENTVTTKYGIPAPPNPGIVRAARRLVAPVLKAVPGIKQRLASAGARTLGTEKKVPFTASDTAASLDHSLRELRLDQVDIFLLHEIEADEASNDGLLRFLEQAVQQGKIGAFGCGSSADKIAALLTRQPALCPVLQFEWSVLDKPLEIPSVFKLHHRALTANFVELRDTLKRDAAQRSRWSEEVGADLAAPGMLAALMLKAALVLNPESIILVSSRNKAHILENARVAADTTLELPARKLYALAQREAATVLVRSSV